MSEQLKLIPFKLSVDVRELNPESYSNFLDILESEFEQDCQQYEMQIKMNGGYY